MQNTGSPLLDQISPKKILLVLLSVLSIGAVFYHYVENLSWLDSIYFCVVTLATVGYGDITPQTDAGKIFTIFYILIGVGIIASTVGYLLRYVAAHQVSTHVIKKLSEDIDLNKKPKK